MLGPKYSFSFAMHKPLPKEAWNIPNLNSTGLDFRPYHMYIYSPCSCTIPQPHRIFQVISFWIFRLNLLSLACVLGDKVIAYPGYSINTLRWLYVYVSEIMWWLFHPNTLPAPPPPPPSSSVWIYHIHSTSRQHRLITGWKSQ